MNDLIKSLKRLWINNLPPEENIHSIGLFRRHIELKTPLKDGQIIIACDTDFILMLDGREIDRGQFSDDKLRKSFTVINLPELAAGPHLLAVKVYYNGGEFSTYSAGLPGLYIAMCGRDFFLKGDENFLAAADHSLIAGAVPAVSPQLGFTCSYDLHKETAWSDPALDDSSWAKACVLERAPDCLPVLRPEAPRPRLREFVPGRMVKHGTRAKFFGDDSKFTSAEKISFAHCLTQVDEADFPCRLSLQKNYGQVSGGFWLLADLGYEETGLVEFELDVPEGSVVYYAHGEHVTDGHVRAELYGRNFADMVIWSGGRRSFTMPFRRVGARYLELHIVTPGECEAIEVFRVGVRPWRLELPEAGAFECSDERLNKLHQYALHTLELCMHDHYEDCPWREQALYTYDSRLQMLYGYYNWGNYQFAAASLELFVPGQWENGHFNLCAPARSRRQIPVYTLVWLEQLYEYYLFSGDKTLFERCRGAAEKIVKLIYSQLDENAGLLREDSGERYWNFYEWREHLEGRGELSGKGFSALYNAYAVAALIAYSILSGDDEARNFAGKLRENMRRIFYQPRSGLFGSFYVDGKVLDIYNDHTQALMVLYGDLEPGLAAGLGARLAQGDCGTPASLSSLYLIIKAMCKSGVDSTLIYDRILQYYQLMLDNPSGTLWETGLGDYDFGYAGSLCHGWSALPTGFAKNCLLGIEPLEPGFASTSIHVRDCGLDFAAGAVPTPHGEITVEWRRTENGVLTVNVRAPKAIKLCIDNVCPVNVEQY